MASKQEISAGRAFVTLFLKNDMTRQLVRALKAAQVKLRNFSRSAISAGRQIATAGLLMAAPFAFATRTFAEFDDAMREVGAVTEDTGANLDMLRDKAKKLGATTSFTAIEVGLLMAELGRASFDPGEIDNMTGSVLSLARATKTEAALAAKILARSIRQFGLEASDSSRVADVLTAAANKSLNTVESLGESLELVEPVADDFNLSLEDTAAVLGTLGNLGIEGSMAGTAMRRILLATGADAEKLKRIFGVEFVDMNGNVRPLVDTLQDVADATRNLGSAARAKKFKDAFGLRGITGASGIGKNIIGARDLRDAIGEAGGVAKRTADFMDSGLGGSLRILKSAIEGVKIAIGEALAPTLQKLAKFITKTLQSTIKWITANQSLIVVLAATAAGITALGVALVGMGLAGALASVVFGGLGFVVSTITSPLGIMTAAVVGAAVAWVKFSDSGKLAWESLKTAFNTIVGDVTTAWDGIKAALSAGDMEAALKVVTSTMQLEWARLVTFWMEKTVDFRAWWGDFTNGLSDMFDAVVDHMSRSWEGFMILLKVGEKALADTVGWVVGTVIGGVPWEEMGPAIDADRRLRNAPPRTDLPGSDGKVSRDSGVVAAREALAAAIKAQKGAVKAAKELAKAAKDQKEKTKAGGPLPAANGPLSATAGSAASAIPKGVALTATYSAAAARISGFQAGGRADGMTETAKNTKELAWSFSQYLANWEKGDTPSKQALRIQQDTLTVWQQFLAGMRVS